MIGDPSVEFVRIRLALKELLKTASVFAKQDGTTEEKALWSAAAWARDVLKTLTSADMEQIVADAQTLRGYIELYKETPLTTQADRNRWKQRALAAEKQREAEHLYIVPKVIIHDPDQGSVWVVGGLTNEETPDWTIVELWCRYCGHVYPNHTDECVTRLPEFAKRRTLGFILRQPRTFTEGEVRGLMAQAAMDYYGPSEESLDGTIDRLLTEAKAAAKAKGV